jgi:lysophospholipase L1-like esterase
VRLAALALGLVLSFATAEAALRIAGTFATYSERNYGEYSEVFGRRSPSWLHTWEPGSTFEFSTAEFRYEYQVNSDGVRDVEHALEAEPGRRRIVVLGDSFTEGVGADRHEAWPAVLGDLLAREGTQVEIFNAGVSGSDPFFEYQLLRQRMLRYRPDVVIVAINESDISDTLWWGGMERFQVDGTSRGRPAPRALQLYRHSHLARWVLHRLAGLQETTLTFGVPGRTGWESQLAQIEAFEAMDALRAQQPFELVVLPLPLPFGVRCKSTGYFQAFRERLAEAGIVSLDISDALHAELAGLDELEYSWPIDKHYNALGYAAVARAVAGVLRTSGLLEGAGSR